MLAVQTGQIDLGQVLSQTPSQNLLQMLEKTENMEIVE
jgi:hypothetical protein